MRLFGRLLSTRSLVKIEYVSSSIKVITVFVFPVLRLHAHLWHWRYISRICELDSGEAPFVGGWESILAIFYGGWFLNFQGTELIGVAAGEVEDPERTCQKRLIQSSGVSIILISVAFIVIGFLIPVH